MQGIETNLAFQPLLRELDAEELETISECAHMVSFDEGQAIFYEGEVAQHFYIITHGKVALQVYGPGRGPITIETIDDGDILGWSWLFPPYRWHFDAQALTATQAIEINAMCLRGKCEVDHSLGYKLVKVFSHLIMERLQATRLRLLDVYAPQ
jgi:CRP-like cAMP-binding protein